MNSIFQYITFGILIIMFFILGFILILYVTDKCKLHNKYKGKMKSTLDYEDENIENLREKFKYDLNGRWSSCEGTFTILMDEVWIFYSNGKGITISKSIMSGEYKEEFRWRKKDLFCIEITYSVFDEPEIWIEIHYDFCRVPTDCGFVNALVQLDEEKKPRKGFGLMEVPLSYENEVN